MLNKWRKGSYHGWSCTKCASGHRGKVDKCPCCGALVEERRHSKLFMWQTEDWEAPIDNPWFFPKMMFRVVFLLLWFGISLVLCRICPPIGMVGVLAFCMVMAGMAGKGMADNMGR